VPVLDLAPELEALWGELSSEALRVLRSGRFVLGPDVEAFEREAAEYLGVKHAVGLNSGTDALFIGLRALGVGPGDEVVTTPFTFFATPEAISLIGATPVFADIEADSFNLDPASLEVAVTGRTRAVIPVHLFGRPVDWEALSDVASRHGLRVLEDCAQSIGATAAGGNDGAATSPRRTGALGDAGAFSFYPTKNLGGFGDGGLLTIDDDGVAETARMLRTHGERSRYRNEMIGYNSRLDALQAALLRVKLRRLDAFNSARRAAARRYGELLADLGAAGVLTTPAVTEGHVFHQYTVRIQGGRRDEVRERLDEAGIGTMVYYPIPCHRLPVYAEAYADVSLPVAEAAADEVLSLPIWPAIEPATQERVAAALADALG
jgi:dTDP-4-amino-4,6-dideoxygalactose transaminase